MAMQEKGKENRAFQEMRKPALDRLAGRRPEEIARRTGISFDREGQVFSLHSLGRDIRIRCPGYEITPELDQWHQLLLLHYLDMADGSALSGRLMAFGDLPGGMARGGGFDRQSERDMSLRLGHCSRETVERACCALGGVLTPSNADVCAIFSLFPRYPITLKIWFADEELPGSGRLFLDEGAGHILSVEDAVTAGSLLLEAVFQEVKALETSCGVDEKGEGGPSDGRNDG